jgi:Photosynthesis system II assembly factor YCF48
MHPSPSRALIVLMLLQLDCRGDCGGFEKFYEDPRLERISPAGSIAIGREGLILWGTNTLSDIVLADSGTDQDLLGVDESRSRALVVGRNGTLRLTDDAGQTWSQPVAPPLTVDLYAVHFGCPDLGLELEQPGLVVGDGGTVLRSLDSGSSWEAANPAPLAALRVVTVLSASEAIVAGEGGAIFRTINLGVTWTPTVKVTDGDIVHLYGAGANCLSEPTDKKSADHVLAAARNGDLLLSPDRGVTWEVFDHFPEGPVTLMLASAEFLDPTVISSSSFWTKSGDRWAPSMNFPGEITAYSCGLIVADGALYGRPGCQEL